MSSFDASFEKAMAAVKRKARAPRAPRTSLRDRILEHIASHQGVTNSMMTSYDLNPRVKYETVKRIADKLQAEGIIERGWDGDAWVLTDAENKRREDDAYFRRAFPSIPKKI